MKFNIQYTERVFIAVFLTILTFLTSCEQEHFEPNLTALPGGGTVTTYKSYTLESTDPGGVNVYGRVVFYKYSSTVTLVQMGLYNTDPDVSYTAKIFNGKFLEGSSTVSKDLDAISGESGAFSTSKYFTISEAGFFDGLSGYNANVRVLMGATAVATGDIGANADPVAESD